MISDDKYEQIIRLRECSKDVVNMAVLMGERINKIPAGERPGMYMMACAALIDLITIKGVENDRRN